MNTIEMKAIWFRLAEGYFVLRDQHGPATPHARGLDLDELLSALRGVGQDVEPRTVPDCLAYVFDLLSEFWSPSHDQLRLLAAEDGALASLAQRMIF